MSMQYKIDIFRIGDNNIHIDVMPFPLSSPGASIHDSAMSHVRPSFCNISVSPSS